MNNGFVLRAMGLVFILAVLVISSGYSQGNAAPGAVVYISLDGNDGWSGSLSAPNADKTDGPLKTLTAARDKVRQIKSKAAQPGPIRILVAGGDYYLDRTLELTEQDSGTQEAPIVYAAAGTKPVRLFGGRPVTGFVPVTNPDILARFKQDCRGSILQADLKSQGITDFGTMVSRGFGRNIEPAGLELFFQNQPQTLARWPNTSWLKINQVPAGQNGGKFTYTESQPDTWHKSDHIWVHGFWTQDWADSYERIQSLDPATKTITTYPPHGIYGYVANHRYYFLNVLEELDSPGEWVLDRDSGILYFWPPAALDKEAPMVSILPTVITMKQCSYVVFEGMTLEYCRATAIEIIGGSANRIRGCTLANIGNSGVLLDGGTDNGVESCDIFNTGDGGIRIWGGDIEKLIPAGLFALNNHIYNYNRWCLTYRPAVLIDGVGNRISHNRIHDGPHNAIQLGGNDHVIEYNEIYNVCTESDDVGAFYAGRNWTCRGTVIRYNYFHDIYSAASQFQCGSRTVYLDDAASGFTVFGNVFSKAGSLCAVNVGGGRDNLIGNNIFIDCIRGALIDTRGLDWAKQHISDGGEWGMYDKLRRVKYNQPPYSTRYPKLATILAEEPAQPRGNELINNVAVRTRILDMPAEWQRLLTNTGNWSTDTDPGFVNAADGDFTLKADSDVFKKCPQFKPIPFKEIGLYCDAFRKQIP